MSVAAQNNTSDQALTTGQVLEAEFKALHSKCASDKFFKDPEPPKLATKPQPKTPEQQAHDEAVRLERYASAASETPQYALCLSGGGIRSAAFALGVLQGLARRELLGQFHYLSTVSGGGYIGSWLSAWKYRAGLTAVQEGLAKREAPNFEEAQPLQRLRKSQNFLTPKLGIASPDTWAAIMTVVRNLLLNWLVFIPLICALLLVPRLILEVLIWIDGVPTRSMLALLVETPVSAWFATDGSPSRWSMGWRSWLDAAAVLLLIGGFAVSAYNRPAADQNWMTHDRFNRAVLAPAFIGALLLTGAVASWVRLLDDALRVRCVVLGIVIYVSARCIAGLCRLVFASPAETDGAQANSVKTDQTEADKAKADQDGWGRQAGSFVLELLGWAAAGACTGLVIGEGISLCASWALDAGPPPFDGVAKVLTVFGPPWIVLSFLLGEIVFVGATSRLPRKERDREWLARAAGSFALVAAAYFAFAAIVVYGWWAIEQIGEWAFVSLLGGSGLLTLVTAPTPLTKALSSAAVRERVPVTKLTTPIAGVFILAACAVLAQVNESLIDGVPRVVAGFTVWLAQVIDVLARSMPAAGAILAGGGEWLRWLGGYIQALPAAPTLSVLGLAAALLAASLLASCLVNVNWFSLHALYRNRLVRTFLGASNPNDKSRNAFDGFSRDDNLPMERLWQSRKRGMDGHNAPIRAGDADAKLFHVVNVALNTVGSKDLAMQERKAQPFIFTPLHAGGAGRGVGYRPAGQYTARPNKPDDGITLGTAMAISGAAVSPNWGYHSSPIVSFLLMLFNVRLGWWLGNPSHAKTWRQFGPHSSWNVFVQEALGRTDTDQPWLYLSDGGHFENLGIYEMVRRRCRTIVVSDAGQDFECALEDLGNAARKISIDLGVAVVFEQIFTQKRANPAVPGVYCAVGRIKYPESPDGPDGTIVYLKPGFYGREPADVRAYAAGNAKFPHESTLDLWFSESQFESYRSLGSHVIRAICPKGEDGKKKVTIEEFVGAATRYVSKYAATYDKDELARAEARRARTPSPPPQRRFGGIFSSRRDARANP